MDMISIQDASLEDIKELREVAISSYHDKFSAYNTPENMQAYYDTVYSLENLIKEYYEPKSKLMLAKESNQILGFIRLRESNEVKNILGENTIELQRLYVLTKAQGKAIGKMLMNKAIEYATAMRYQWVWLGVWERNLQAQNFYSKYGFEKFSQHTFWQGNDPQIDWLLKKKL